MATAQSLSTPDRNQPLQDLIGVLQAVEAVEPTLNGRSCRWQDVVDAIDAAKALDNAKAGKSFLRARLRNSGPEVTMLEALVGMIPDQDGLSVLRGGLVTMLKLVALRLEVRQMILQAFEDIPETFVKAVEAARRFPDARDLRNAVLQLFDTLVRNVGTLIQILLRNHPDKNLVVRLWKQRPGKEAEDVRGCLEMVSRAANRVRECSTAALERTVGEVRAQQNTIIGKAESLIVNVRAVGEEVRAGFDGIQSVINDGVARLESRDKRLLEALKDALDKQGEIRVTSWQQLHGAHGPQHPAVMWSQTEGGVMAAPQLLSATSFALRNPLLLQPVTTSVMLPSTSLSDLLETLGVPEQAPAEALSRVAQRAHNLHVDAGVRGEHLLMEERFLEWLTSPHWVSDLLMVEGHCGSASTSRLSPMSAICASLVQVLEDIDGGDGSKRHSAVCLHYFCGQHLGQQDPLRGPVGLVKSLVQQLLQQSQPQPALDFVDDNLFTSVECHDIEGLCRLFCELFVRLDPSRPVFCIIDSISVIETALDGWQHQSCLIANSLLGLVDDLHRAGPALRVLLTCVKRSAALADLVVPPERRISLLRAHLPGRRSSLSQFQSEADRLLMSDDVGSSTRDIKVAVSDADIGQDN